ncbi:MAG: HIT-like protein [Candidatus Omnitrophica bacterium ADurb.Bin277]|nr:MAG: HIT-like protein [Candidatus Omnitrophica bacterium ADurb.Bin277]
MTTIFSKILSGELPCHKILEDSSHLAFLDIRPVNPGHTLVIPKLEIDYIFDMEDNLLGDLMAFSKKVAKAIRKTVPCLKVGIMVAGLEVPHTHIHLIPISAISDLNFARAQAVSQVELAAMAQKLRSNL